MAIPPNTPPHQPPSVPGRLREQTQDAILQAAEEIIGQEGVALARTDAIAAQAGVSVGTLYKHFGDREGLIGALIESRQSELLDQFRTLVAAPGETFVGDLHRFFAVFEHAGKRHGRLFAATMNDEVGARTWHCKRDEIFAELMAIIDVLLHRGQEEGVIAPRGDRMHVLAALSLGRMMLFHTCLGGFAPDRHEIVDFFLHGAATRVHGQGTFHGQDTKARL